MIKLNLCLFISFIFSLQIIAQETYLGYSFNPWGYEYYTELSNATISTATGNDGAENINLPFIFQYMGQSYNTARISVNGWIELGQTYTGLGYDNDLASTTAKPLICPLWDDLIDDDLSEIKYKTIGVAPTRELIIEWKDILVSGTRKSFQVKLFELDGTIAFHYGPQNSPGYFSASIGMNDYIGGTGHFLSVTTDQFASIDTLVANNNINSFENIGENTNFYFIPAGKAYYITTYQITDNVIKGSVNQPIIVILITSRTGVLTMPSVTSISLSTNGTTNTNDILNAKLFSTGTSPYFNTNYPVGNTVNLPNGNFSISGGCGLQDFATNYIWLTYDVSDNAQIGNLLDAEALQLFFDVTFSHTPDVTAPPGNRSIVQGEGLAGSYTIGATGDFISLTEIADTLTETFMTAPITIELLNDYNSSNENFPITLPFINGSSEQNKIIIRPASDATDVEINGNGSAILKFNNATNYNIDGRPGGNGESKSLTIQNLDTSGSTIQFTNDSKNIVITHTKILGCSISENKGVVEFSEPEFNLRSDKVIIDNCFIGKSSTGRPTNCFYFGGLIYGGITNWKISNCAITDFTSIGINFETGYTTTIENSEIYLTEPTSKNKVSGIKMIDPVWSLRIAGNKIHSLSSSNSFTNYITGIEIPFSSAHDIINNFISLSGNEYSVITGIDYDGEYASYDSIYNNTIYIFGSSLNEQNSYCFRKRARQYYAGLSLRLKNNIFINKRFNVQGFGRHYAIAIEDQRGVHQLDYNNYYVSGNGTHLGKWLTDDVNDLSTWRVFSQKDEHSISKNVNFISQTDLHLTGSSLGDDDLIAQPNLSVLVDIDNEPRSIYFPYMGADESTDYPLPVELTSFVATVVSNNVSLKWQTATETNNSGFQIERREKKNERSFDWNNIGFVEGIGTTTEPQIYTFVDRNLEAGKYQYRLKQIDFDGTFEYSNNIEVEIGIPTRFSLEQNFPNPFNPGTKIRWQSPISTHLTLRVYDVLGNEVAKLVDEYRNAGSYEVEFDASQLASGVYYYQLLVGDFIETKKMILLK